MSLMVLIIPGYEPRASSLRNMPAGDSVPGSTPRTVCAWCTRECIPGHIHRVAYTHHGTGEAIPGYTPPYVHLSPRLYPGIHHPMYTS